MILVDTSVWVEYLRGGARELAALLDQGLVLVHPFVVGELACGNLKDRARVLAWLNQLACAKVASHGDVLWMLETHQLAGRGVGWMDMHLLASVMLTRSKLWTLDKKLAAIALEFDAV